MSRNLELVDRSDFRRALNADFQLDPHSTAVLAIDLHRGHLDPAIATLPLPAAKADAVVAASRRLFTACRASAIPIIYLVLQNRRLPTIGTETNANPFWRAVEGRQTLAPGARTTQEGHNLEGSPQTEIVAALRPEPQDFVITTKRRLDAFYQTDLEHLLRGLKSKTVVLAGVNTNTCVLNTAFAAFNRDYRVVVVEDCVASMYGDDLHVLGLENIARCLGWVFPLNHFLKLLSEAGEPRRLGD
jgi:nicotinamidase-related amidase